MATSDPLPDFVNIADAFLSDRLREGRGERIALRMADTSLTYRDVEALASGYAAALTDCGVRREERVVIPWRAG